MAKKQPMKPEYDFNSAVSKRAIHQVLSLACADADPDKCISQHRDHSLRGWMTGMTDVSVSLGNHCMRGAADMVRVQDQSRTGTVRKGERPPAASARSESADALEHQEEVVRVRRLELPRHKTLEPKSSASTNSATPAQARQKQD